MTFVPRSSPIRAWHFLYESHLLRTGEAAPADGTWLTVPAPIELCQRGLHASRHPFDALRHAPGPVLCLVDCAGEVLESNDKLVCTERRIVARMDAEDLLRLFARQQALSVLHLYPGQPDQVVLDYLMTGDESLRSAAWSAARSAARSAAWPAAWPAARSAAWSASATASATASVARSASATASVAASVAESQQRDDFQALVHDAFADWL